MARDLFWVGSSQKDFWTFPEKVRTNIMAALYLAQDGKKATNTKPLQGFSGASVLEIVERDPSGAYRCIYTVKLQTRVYILHAFQKKSRQGISTPQEHIDMVKRRLKWANEIDIEITKQEKRGEKPS